MKCIRCGKDLDRADDKNSDYVIADEFIVDEKREKFWAIKKDKTKVPLKKVEEALSVNDLDRIEVTIEDTPVQKTGLVCPDCYKPTDIIIWGVHK